jgi:hypothetical protein
MTASLKNADASDPWYDLACIDATTGHKNEALDDLDKAVKAGFTDAQELRIQEDLKSLRSDPRFASIVARTETPVAARTK